MDGTFELNGTYHIFRCCDFHHLSAPGPAGPWMDLGTAGSPARDGGYISGSATVVAGVPRMVMPLFRGNARKSHCCAAADGKPHDPPWRYPCIANPPQGACHMVRREKLIPFFHFTLRLSRACLGKSHESRAARNFNDGKAPFFVFVPNAYRTT